MASQVDICNSALSLLGDDIDLVSITDNTKQGKYCKLAWDSCVESILRAYPWGFAVKRYSLAKTTEIPWRNTNDRMNVALPLYTDLKKMLMERNILLQGTQNNIDRYRNQKELGLVTTDSEEVYKQLLSYTQYLRDYPSGENWWVSSPKTFNEYNFSSEN